MYLKVGDVVHCKVRPYLTRWEAFLWRWFKIEIKREPVEELFTIVDITTIYH